MDLPVLNTRWSLGIAQRSMVRKISVRLYRSTLQDQRPPFPFREIPYGDMVESFQKLKKADYTKFITPTDQLEREVFEKYDDYKYPFSDYGLGVLDTPSTFNTCSDYFHESSPTKVWFIQFQSTCTSMGRRNSKRDMALHRCDMERHQY